MVPLLVGGAIVAVSALAVRKLFSKRSTGDAPQPVTTPSVRPVVLAEIDSAIEAALLELPTEKQLTVMALVRDSRRQEATALAAQRGREIESPRRQQEMVGKMEATVKELGATNTELRGAIAPLQSEIKSLTGNLVEANRMLGEVKTKAESVRTELRGAHQELRSSRIEGALMNILSLFIGLFGGKVADLLQMSTFAQVSIFVGLVLIMGLIFLRATVSVAVDPLPDLNDANSKASKQRDHSRSSYSDWD